VQLQAAVIGGPLIVGATARLRRQRTACAAPPRTLAASSSATTSLRTRDRGAVAAAAAVAAAGVVTIAAALAVTTAVVAALPATRDGAVRLLRDGCRRRRCRRQPTSPHVKVAVCRQWRSAERDRGVGVGCQRLALPPRHCRCR